MDAPDDPIVGLHYVLSAYISAGQGIIRSPFGAEPVMFTKIFNERPDNARYAVGRMIPLKRVMVNGAMGYISAGNEPSGPFVVWDLFDDHLVSGRRTAPTGLHMPPPPRWMGESEDGLIMKAVALYGDV